MGPLVWFEHPFTFEQVHEVFVHGDSSEPSLLASTKYGRRQRVGPKFTFSDLPDNVDVCLKNYCSYVIRTYTSRTDPYSLCVCKKLIGLLRDSVFAQAFFSLRN